MSSDRTLERGDIVEIPSPQWKPRYELRKLYRYRENALAERTASPSPATRERAKGGKPGVTLAAFMLRGGASAMTG